jgi:hypothetical protein
MSNPSKAKGTGFEREVTNRGLEYGLNIVREPAGAPWDHTVRGSTGRTIEALVTRPDRGRALATIALDDLFHILAEHGDNAHIECKRFARIALHTIYEKKFPRRNP